MNKTPWSVIVYSGRAHWDKPIEELEEAFQTRSAAESYAATIRKYNPGYYTDIYKED